MKFLQEGFLANFLSRFIDLVLLGVLWFVCSIPIFTLGASTCAVYTVTLRYALHEDPPIVRTFFEAFRKNFAKGTALFFLVLGAGIFLFLDLLSAFQWNIGIKYLMVVVILSVCYFYLAVSTHVFAVLSYFGTGVKESIKKAFLLSMKNGIYTVFIMILNILPALAILRLPAYFGQILFVYFILGFSAIAYFCSLHLIRLFDPERAKAADELEYGQPDGEEDE